jgi:hypothetical protein
MVIDGVNPEILLPLEQAFIFTSQRPEIKDEAMMSAVEDVPAEALFSQVYVDKEKLKNRISSMLQSTRQNHAPPNQLRISSGIRP